MLLSYLANDAALKYPIIFLQFNIFWTWLVGEFTGNVSQVDRVWSILPTVYTSYFALYPIIHGGPTSLIAEGMHPRGIVMMVLQILWSTRLSYNTWRRGLFNPKDEDYRWAILRTIIPPWLFQIFNLTFIAIIQNILLFMLALPAHQVLLQPRTSLPLSYADYTLTALSLLTLLLEFISDNQQYSYQTFKQTDKINENEWWGARIKWTKEDKERGFVTRGLWSLSRHPNFLCEQTFWALQSFFPLLSTSYPPISPPSSPTSLIPLLPPLSLCVLFYCSASFSEWVSARKYPLYSKYYCKRVGMFSPAETWIKGCVLSFKGGRGEAEEGLWGRPKATNSKRVERANGNGFDKTS